MPQEVSAAVFGNPATLTQFSGMQFGMGAAILKIDLENTQTGAGGTNVSGSVADDYVIPDFAFSNQIGESWVIGAGVQVGAGLGADFRDDPVRVGALPGTELPFNSELLSFNANVSVAKQITPSISIEQQRRWALACCKLAPLDNRGQTYLQGRLVEPRPAYMTLALAFHWE